MQTAFKIASGDTLWVPVRLLVWKVMLIEALLAIETRESWVMPQQKGVSQACVWSAMQQIFCSTLYQLRSPDYWQFPSFGLFQVLLEITISHRACGALQGV